MILETDRLKLRRFELSDRQFILRLLNTDGWLRFIGDRNVQNEKDAESYLAGGPLKSYADNDFGLSMVELKSSGQPVGMCGLIKRPGLDDADLGFAFLPEHGGQGYATEISKAVLNEGFTRFNLPRLLAITQIDNAGSISVLKKCGMTETGKVVLPGETTELLRFEMENPRKLSTFPAEFINLKGPRIRLREVVKEEAGDVLEIFTYASRPAKDIEGVIRILDRGTNDFKNRLSINWGIEHPETKKIIGTIGYYRGFPEQCGEVGFVLKEAYRRQGYMHDALQLVLEFGYATLKLKQITAWTKADNFPCQGLLARNNFVALNREEGGYSGFVHRRG